jgi:hypothetical protein
LSLKQLIGKLYLTYAGRLQIDALVVEGVRVRVLPGTSAFKDTPRYKELLAMVEEYETLKSRPSSAQQASRQQQDILNLLLTVRSFLLAMCVCEHPAH